MCWRMIEPSKVMDLEERTQPLCLFISKPLEEEDGRDSLYNFLSRIDINFSLQIMQMS